MSKPKEPSRAVKNAIMNVLTNHRGSENVIKRAHLFTEVNQMLTAQTEKPLVDDRDMRNAIYHLRCLPEGFNICFIYPSKNNDGGYFLARNLPELEAHLRPDINRAITTYKRINAQLKHAKSDISPQLSLDLPMSMGAGVNNGQV